MTTQLFCQCCGYQSEEFFCSEECREQCIPESCFAEDNPAENQIQIDAETVGKWERFSQACLAKYGIGCFAPENIPNLSAEDAALLEEIEAASERQCARQNGWSGEGSHYAWIEPS